MTEPARLSRLRVPLLAIAVAGSLVAGAVALYGTRLAGSNAAAAPGCEAAARTAARMAPLARGEVAAVTIDPAPKPARELAFNGPEGRRITTADLKGRTVLLNLWATWCAPCRQEMPALDRLQAEMGGPAFEVVAVNLDTRNLDKPKAWLAANGIGSLAYYADPDGRLLPALQRAGEAVGLPTSYVIDPAGCEVAAIKGPADWASEDAARLVRAALGR